MGGPRIQVVTGAEELARAGADLVGAVVATAPTASIVVPTGRTPEGLYVELTRRREHGSVDLSRTTVYQLDEYLDLEPGDRRSLFGWMRRSFLQPLGIDDEQIVRLPTDGNLDAACPAYDRALEARGGIDLAILGLGQNGHLGFNEPPSSPTDPTRVVMLSPETIEANARYWGDVGDVPTRAVTMGMRPLLSARAIVLLVAGPNKHRIVHRALEGPIDPEVPASFLQDTGSDVTVLVDRDAWEGG